MPIEQQLALNYCSPILVTGPHQTHCREIRIMHRWFVSHMWHREPQSRPRGGGEDNAPPPSPNPQPPTQPPQTPHPNPHTPTPTPTPTHTPLPPHPQSQPSPHSPPHPHPHPNSPTHPHSQFQPPPPTSHGDWRSAMPVLLRNIPIMFDDNPLVCVLGECKQICTIDDYCMNFSGCFFI